MECQAAAAFLASFLPAPISSPVTTSFSDSLATILAARFAQHWHPSDPERGSAYRALVRFGPSAAALDPAILAAARTAGIGPREISKALTSAGHTVTLGDRWTLWVDPGSVSIRVENGAGRDGHFVELYGRLPRSLVSHSIAPVLIPASAQKSASLNNFDHSTSPEMDLLISPTKRSKAITIMAPPLSKPLSAMGALLLSSPLPSRQYPALPVLCASPFVTPPTPSRPLSSSGNVEDVFASPSRVSRPPSPYAELSLHQRASSISLGAPNDIRRSSSRASSCDDGSGSDNEFGAGSEGGSSIFSMDSISSSVTSLGGLLQHGRNASGSFRMDGEFKYPPVPTRTHSSSSVGSYMANPGFSFPAHPSHQHSRSLSFSSTAPFPPTSPTKLGFVVPRSLPSSPSKPRRRGTRGAGSSHHEHGSSISSISSITFQHSSAGPVPFPAGAPNATNPRTREQALAGTLQEHSGGKVVVLGGGVLLGLAGAGRTGHARAEVLGEAKRRGRERRGRGRSGVLALGANGQWEM